MESYQKWADFIDTYIGSEVVENNIEDSVGAYHRILDDIIMSLNLNPDTKSSVKLDKIYRWLKNVIIPQQKIDRRKKEILNG